MKHKAQGGAAAVEFALVFPIFLLLVFAIIEFGFVLYDKAVITNASREMARKGVILQKSAHTSDELKSILTKYQGSLVSFKTLPNNPSMGDGDPPGLNGGSGTPLSVTVTYNYYGLGLGPFLSPFTGGALALSATTVMNNE